MPAVIEADLVDPDARVQRGGEVHVVDGAYMQKEERRSVSLTLTARIKAMFGSLWQIRRGRLAPWAVT